MDPDTAINRWSDSLVSRLQAILVSIVLIATMTLATYTHVIFVAVLVLVIQAMIAAAPAPADERGRSVASPRFAPAFAAGALATILTLWPDLLGGAPGTTSTYSAISNGVLAGIMPGVALGVIVTLIAQMFRRDGRANLVLSVGYTVTLCMFATLPVAWLAATQSFGRSIVVALGAVGVVVAMLVWAVPKDRFLVGVAAVLAAGLAGIGVAVVVPTVINVNLAFAAVTSGCAAFFAIIGLVVGRNWCRGRLRVADGWGFPSAIALAIAGPVVYVAGQLVSLA